MAAEVLSGFALIINTCLIYILAMSGCRSEKNIVRNSSVIVVPYSHFSCQRKHTILLQLDSLPPLGSAAMTDSEL